MAAAVTPMAGPLRIITAIVLAGVAGSITLSTMRATHSTVPNDEPARRLPHTPSVPHAYADLLTLTITNPTTIIYFITLIIKNHSTTTISNLTNITFILNTFITSTDWQLLLINNNHTLNTLTSNTHNQLIINLTTNLLVLTLTIHTTINYINIKTQIKNTLNLTNINTITTTST